MSDQALIYGGILLAILMVASGFGWLRGGGDTPAQREEERGIASEVIGRFVFRIALPVLLLLGVPIILLAAAFDADTRVLQALVAGLVIALGWLTTSIFNELERKRARAERLRDYHKALYGEIRNALSTLYKEGEADSFAQAIIERMQSDDSFVPFIPREHHDRVFNALVADIEVLPRQTIDVVIGFYAMMRSIEALAEDMRSDAFRALSQPRRIAIYQDYVDLRVRAFQLGEYTLSLINAFSEGGAAQAERFATRFNSQGADHSPPSEGSE